MRFCWLVACFLLFNFISNGKNKPEATIYTAEDSTNIILFNQQALKYLTLQPDSAIYYGELALKLSIRSKQFDHLNETHKIIGWCYFQQHDYKKAQTHLQFAVSDTTLNIADRIKIYDALAIASENNHDYQNAFQFLKKSQQVKVAVSEQKQSMALSDLQRQLDIQQELQKAELKQQSAQLKFATDSEDQLKQIFLASEVLLLLVVGLLCFLLYYNNKKFKKSIKEKDIAIAEANTQLNKLQNEMSGFEQLKTEIEEEKRETRIHEIETEPKLSPKREIKESPPSLVEQYPNASADDKRKMQPLFTRFLEIVSNELQNIEQAFSKHDWQAINTSLQNMKPAMQDLRLSKNEILITEINDHVNANAANRAVVKLLQVKSSCIKNVSLIKGFLESNQ